MKKIKNLDLWIILGCVTLAAIIIAIVLVVKPGQIKSFDDIKTVTVEDYKSKGASTYFVFLYDKENPALEHVNNIIIEYAEYSRSHKKAPKIYIMSTQDNPTIFDDFKTEKISASSAPCLVTITDGKYTPNTNNGKICNILADYINGKK